MNFDISTYLLQIYFLLLFFCYRLIDTICKAVSQDAVITNEEEEYEECIVQVKSNFWRQFYGSFILTFCAVYIETVITTYFILR